MNRFGKRLTILVGVTALTALWIGYRLSGGLGMGDYLDPVEGGYFYFSDKRMIASNPRSTTSPSIPSEILEYTHGDGFILARRKGYPYAPETAVDYWILDTRGHRVFGPMTAEEYSEARTKLKVPVAVALTRTEDRAR